MPCALGIMSMKSQILLAIVTLALLQSKLELGEGVASYKPQHRESGRQGDSSSSRSTWGLCKHL